MKINRFVAFVLLIVFAGLALAPSAVNFGGVDSAPANGFAITPNDSTPLANVTRSIWVGTGGDIEVIYAGNDADLVLHSVPTGSRLWGRFSKVKAASTTASNLLGEY